MKKDIIVTFICVLFLLANLGAISRGGRRRAKDAVCRMNLKRWGMIFKTFVDDNDGYFFPDLDWLEELEGYYERGNLFLCPDAAKLAEATGEVFGGKFNAWARESNGDRIVGSYGFNQYVTNPEFCGRSCDELWRTPYVLGASEVPLLVDSARYGLTPQEFDQPPEWDGQVSSWVDYDEIRRCCIDRHTGGVNIVYLDFSARKVGLKYLWLQKWHRRWSLPPDPLPVWPDWMSKFKDP